MSQDSGTIQKKYSSEEIEVHWEIPDFLSQSKKELNSPNFKFLNIEWYLRLQLPSIVSGLREDDDITLFLDVMDNNLSFFIMSTFGVKKIDGSMTKIYTTNHTFNAATEDLMVEKFLTRSALLERESQLMPSNKLTIICKLKNLPSAKSSEPRDLNTLSENIKGLLGNEEFCDITVRVKDKEFKAHKIILAARCPLFARMLSHETPEYHDGIIDLKDYKFDPESFQEFLQYIYSGQLSDLSYDTACSLVSISNRCFVSELENLCLEKMKEKMRIQDFYGMVMVNGFGHFSDVMQDFFNRNYKEVIASDEWEDFSTRNKSLASSLLQNIDLYAE